jgi:NAD(P)-dependent dehydrogenase (short-subunit alcohol dehydrogenase family)
MEFQNQTIAITASTRPLASALTQAFSEGGGAVIAIPADMTASEFARQHPIVDVLVLLPDPLPVGPTLELEAPTGASTLARAFVGSFQLMQALGAGMVARRRGCILTVGSLAGSKGWPGWAQTSALQGALLGLTRSLAVEWAPHNVRVLYLACAAAEGEPAHSSGVGPSSAELAARTPLGRVAQAQEIAKTAAYLASSRAGSLTGSEIRADGGWSAWGLLK